MGLVTMSIDDAHECPFCIRSTRMLMLRTAAGCTWVQCKRCEARGPSTTQGQRRAIERWNRRRNDPATKPMTTDEVRTVLADTRLEDDDER